MLIDEMTVLKGVMVQISPEAAVLVTLQYHSEPGENGKKYNSKKSSKRWIARIDTLENFKKMVKDLSADSARLNPNSWPDDPAKYRINFGNDSSNGKFADILETKIKKLKSWTDGMNIFDGWQTKTPKRQAGYNLNAKYDTEGWQDKEGKKFSLKDKDELLKRVGQTIWKPFVKMSKVPIAPPSSQQPAQQAIA